MRKITLIMIIVWSLLALLIIAALVGGIVYRGSAGISGITSFADSGGSREMVYENTFPIDGIKDIDISLSSETVDIFPSKDNTLRVVQYGHNLDRDRVIVAEQQGDTLSIRRGGSGNRNFFFGFGINRNRSWVEVYLPAPYRGHLKLDLTSGSVRIGTDLNLKDLGIDISSGTIRSDYGITAQEADIFMTSGTLRLDRLSAKEFSIDVSSGTVRVDHLAGSGRAQITTGSLRLYNVEIADHLSADSSSGTIAISLLGEPSLDFAGEVSSGTLHTYFDTYRKGDHDREYFAKIGDAPYKTLTTEVTSGTVRITRADGSSIADDDTGSKFGR